LINHELIHNDKIHHGLDLGGDTTLFLHYILQVVMTFMSK
jgi:hypothetical protein